jgi:NADH:ubiquinone oxidoreductase subunit 6 (subunit J)
MAHEWAKGLLCLVLLTGLMTSVLWNPNFRRDTPRQETFEGLAGGLFGNWVFAFELLSLLLLAALIGALFLSQKLGRREDESP